MDYISSDRWRRLASKSERINLKTAIINVKAYWFEALISGRQIILKRRN